MKAGCTSTGRPARSAAAQNTSNTGSSSRCPAIEVPIAAPTQPCASAARYTSAARGGSCIGRLASHFRRSGCTSQNFAIPSFAASHSRAPMSLLTS